jgi:hypothetical protein
MSRAFKRIPRALALVLSAALALAAGLALQPPTGAKATGNVAALVGELNVGAGHSFHSSGNRMIEFRDRLFFWADDGSGFALWSFDGTTYAKPSVDEALAAGEPGLPSSQSFAVFQDKLYFNGVKSGGAERELFVFDGTSVKLAHDFENFANPSQAGLSNGDVASLVATPHGLFMSATGQLTGEPSARSRALWRWDGTSMHFVAAPGGTSSNLINLSWLENRLFFSADGALGASRPWVYDPRQPVSAGTLNSTTNPADLGIIGNQTSHFTSDFGALGGKVYFGSHGNADDGTTAVGRELWAYDPSLPVQAAPAPQGTQRNPALVADIRAGSNSSTPDQFLNHGGELFFRASVAFSDQRLHHVNSSGQVETLAAVNNGATIVVRTVLNGQIVFTSHVTPLEVYTFNPTDDSLTKLLTAEGANLQGFINFKGELHWVSDLGAGLGRELYRFGPVTDAATIDPNPLLLPAASSAPNTTPSYQGPIIERVSPNPAFAGEVVEISGLRLEGVSALSIDGQELEITQTDAALITARLPETLAPGLKDLVATSSSGLLTVQGALEIAIGALSVAPTFYTKMNLEQGVLKIYARNVVGVGKVQFFANGREIAWVRAADAEDARLNLRAHGMVRSVPVAEMLAGKNSFEIHVDGQRVLRRAHTR